MLIIKKISIGFLFKDEEVAKFNQQGEKL